MLKKILLLCLFAFWLIPLSAQQKAVPVKSAQTPVKSVKSPPKSAKAPVKSVTAPPKSVKAPVKSVKAPVKSVKIQPKPVKTTAKATVAIPKGISAARSERLAHRIEAQKSLVLLKNESNLLPLGRLDTLKVLVVTAGLGEENHLLPMVGRYTKADYLNVEPKANPGSIRRNMAKFTAYNLVILAIGEQAAGNNANEGKLNRVNELAATEGDHSLTDQEQTLMGEFSSNIKIVCLLFGSRQFLNRWDTAERSSAILIADQAGFDRIDLSIQLLFGAIPSVNQLPFELWNYKEGFGVRFPSIDRLSYVLPEEIGIDSVRLAQNMDSLVRIGLKEKAYPGCQMLLAKNGKVFYQRSYGYHTYDQKLAVQNDDLYDLASVTKILAPVPALMMLADQKKFQVSKKMSDYWTDWKGSTKEALLASDVLSHQARLRPGIILWPKTIDNRGMYKSDYLATKPAPGYELKLSEGLYLKNSFPDQVLKEIDASPLLRTKKYVYSDLGFVLFPKVIENLSGETYQSFLYNHFYSKLGATTLMFNPWQGTSKAKIVPTEDDRAFRRELLQGYVHDETAALMGGVSGNAGLFGSCNDVAKIMQLYLQEGTYGNERYISAETLKNWTSSHPQKISNRRGYGFDKPAIRVSRQKTKERYPSGKVSEQSFGHSGFTGTFTWADPANKLLFVFLSNRVFPDRDNQKINKLKLRTLLLDNLFKMADEPAKKH